MGANRLQRKMSRGFRRLFPSKKLRRAGHAVSSSKSLRSNLQNIMDMYDAQTFESNIDEDAFREAVELTMTDSQKEDLLGCVITEFMTAALARPGEALPKQGALIKESDVQLEFSGGKLATATVMLTPIKQQGNKKVEKVPIPLLAHTGGYLRTAELLHIYLMVKDRRGKERSLFEQWSDGAAKRVTQNWLMKWYHYRCRQLNIPHHGLIKPHSFRIGGATALMAAGRTQQDIKNMGRWASDVYLIYSRVCRKRLLTVSADLSRADTQQWLGAEDGFFDAEAGLAAEEAFGAETDSEGEYEGET